MRTFNKKILLAGIASMTAAFICVVAVFYFSLEGQRAQDREIRALQEELLAATTERDLAEEEADFLEEKVGQTIYLEELLEGSKKFYGDEERKRQEGFLWIDRKNATMLVTLGALNGLGTGSRLTVWDGDDMAGHVRVEIPLDVISYVRPADPVKDVFEKDYYRVKIE